MGLTLAPAPPSSFPILVRLFNSAFKDDPTQRIYYPNGHTEETIAESISEYTEAQRHSSCHHVAVTDTSTGEIISFARWNAHPSGRPEAEWQKSVDKQEGDSAAVRYDNDFFGQLYEDRKRRWRGDPIYYLNILVTAPAHRNRGAASMLIKWGTDQADAVGAPAHLEASASGLKLYERHGFEKVGEIVMDLSQYGADGFERVAIMVREPQKFKR